MYVAWLDCLFVNPPLAVRCPLVISRRPASEWFVLGQGSLGFKAFSDDVIQFFAIQHTLAVGSACGHGRCQARGSACLAQCLWHSFGMAAVSVGAPSTWLLAGLRDAVKPGRRAG